MYSILPVITFLFILISGIAVTSFLKGTTDKKNINLIFAIILFPAVPLFWLLFNETNTPGSILWTFYIPLTLTVIYILMLIVRLYDVFKS